MEGAREEVSGTPRREDPAPAARRPHLVILGEIQHRPHRSGGGDRGENEVGELGEDSRRQPGGRGLGTPAPPPLCHLPALQSQASPSALHVNPGDDSLWKALRGAQEGVWGCLGGGGTPATRDRALPPARPESPGDLEPGPGSQGAGVGASEADPEAGGGDVEEAAKCEAGGGHVSQPRDRGQAPWESPRMDSNLWESRGYFLHGRGSRDPNGVGVGVGGVWSEARALVTGCLSPDLSKCRSGPEEPPHLPIASAFLTAGHSGEGGSVFQAVRAGNLTDAGRGWGPLEEEETPSERDRLPCV